MGQARCTRTPRLERTDLPGSARGAWDRVAITRYVDHTADGAPVGRYIVLPGSKYTPDGPMLFFATQVALMRGWDVRPRCSRRN